MRKYFYLINWKTLLLFFILYSKLKLQNIFILVINNVMIGQHIQEIVWIYFHVIGFRIILSSRESLAKLFVLASLWLFLLCALHCVHMYREREIYPVFAYIGIFKLICWKKNNTSFKIPWYFNKNLIIAIYFSYILI